MWVPSRVPPGGSVKSVPRFTTEELWSLEDDARNCLLTENFALADPDRWVGTVIELARALRNEMDTRLNG